MHLWIYRQTDIQKDPNCRACIPALLVNAITDYRRMCESIYIDPNCLQFGKYRQTNTHILPSCREAVIFIWMQLLI